MAWPISTGTSWPGSVGTDTNYVRLFQEAYVAEIKLKAQQLTSRLSGTTLLERWRGDPLNFDSYQSVSLTTRERGQLYGNDTAGGDKNYSETITERRSKDPEYHEFAELFDVRDEPALMRAIRPGSPYMMNVSGAINRKIDEIIITAFDANCTINGSDTDYATDNGTTVDEDFGSANSGLTLAKIIEAHRNLMANGLEPGEELYAAVHPNQVADLLNDSTITSADYNSVRLLMSGQIDTFMGFRWRTCPEIPQEAANAFDTGVTGRYGYFYAKSGMVAGPVGSAMVKFSEIADRGHAIQAFHSIGFGAMRCDGKKVARVECVET